MEKFKSTSRELNPLPMKVLYNIKSTSSHKNLYTFPALIEKYPARKNWCHQPGI